MNSRIQTLVDAFIEHTIAADEATKIASSKPHRHYQQLYEAFKSLTNEYGDNGRDALATLFEHENKRVRSMAAAYLLRYKHEDAIAVLQDLAKGQGLIAFGAAQAIERWEDGTWELDPEPYADGT